MLKSPALSLRHTTLKKSFDLDEKFFDAVNLETSCKKTKTFQYIHDILFHFIQYKTATDVG